MRHTAASAIAASDYSSFLVSLACFVLPLSAMSPPPVQKTLPPPLRCLPEPSCPAYPFFKFFSFLLAVLSICPSCDAFQFFLFVHALCLCPSCLCCPPSLRPRLRRHDHPTRPGTSTAAGILPDMDPFELRIPPICAHFAAKTLLDNGRCGSRTSLATSACNSYVKMSL